LPCLGIGHDQPKLNGDDGRMVVKVHFQSDDTGVKCPLCAQSNKLMMDCPDWVTAMFKLLNFTGKEKI
jgi:hypothetical protein